MPDVDVGGAGAGAEAPAPDVVDGAEVTPQVPVPPPVPPEPLLPSSEIIKEALKLSVVTDDRGRQITLQKPNAYAPFALLELAGPQRSVNEALMGQVQPLLYVTKIDSDPISRPVRWVEIEALILRLDDDGMAAVMVWYIQNVIMPANNQLEQEAQKARVKN